MGRSYRHRVLLVFLSIIVIAQISIFVAVLETTRENVMQSAAQELQLGQRVFSRLLQSRGERLAASVNVLSQDDSFKKAVAVNDGATLDSLLANHGARVNADLTMLIDRQNRTIATIGTGDEARKSFIFPFTGLLDPTAEKTPAGKTDTEVAATKQSVAEPLAEEPTITEQTITGEAAETEAPEPAYNQYVSEELMASSYVTLDEHAYQVTLSPIFSPKWIGWVSLGFEIDDALARDIRSLTSLEVTFFKGDSANLELVASTLPEEARTQLRQTARAGWKTDGPASAIWQVLLGDEEYITTVKSFSRTNIDLKAVLQTSVTSAMAPYNELKFQLFTIFLVTIVSSVLLAIALSRGITQPVQILVNAARRIQQGHYDEAIRLDRKDDLGELAKTLNGMQDGIAEREDRILYQSSHDALTGLPNRAAVDRQLTKAIEHASATDTSFAVLLMDLNRFKEINDTLGHQIGDQVLIETARRLTYCSREKDTVARLGGDEFLLIAEIEDTEAAKVIIRRFQEELEKPFIIDDINIHMEVCLGMSIYDEHGKNIEDLLRRADIAMYDAKDALSRWAIYQSGQEEEHLRKLALVNDLHQAIREDHLFVHYQPKLLFDSTEETLPRVEALVRWQHPERGMIPPDEFIALAEKAGNIRPLTEWVLREVVEQIVSWKSQGLEVNVAVNLSALDLMDADLPETIEALLASRGLTSENLTIEITESAIMMDARQAGFVLQKLKDLGLRLAIDDFGTGHASLAQLKRLPVDELKIDKSFVTNMSDNPDDQIIVRSTIELGHNMGLEVIAEGVETMQCWSLLKSYQCNMAQGFLFSKPLPPDEIFAWLNEQPETVGGVA